MTQQTVLFALTAVASGAVAPNRFICFDGTQNAVAGAKAMGVSEYAALPGQAFAVNVIGTSKVVAGAAIPLLTPGPTPVKSDAAGKAIPQAGAGEILGYALQPAPGAEATIEILLTP